MKHKETCVFRVFSLLFCYWNSWSKCGEVQGQPEQTPRAQKGAPLSRAKGTAVLLGPLDLSKAKTATEWRLPEPLLAPGFSV